METATVTFKNDENEIVIKFQYDKEKNILDYDFDNVPDIDDVNESNLVTVLTTYFLNSLMESPTNK